MSAIPNDLGASPVHSREGSPAISPRSSIDLAEIEIHPGEHAPLDLENLENAEKNEGITLGKVANAIARGLAGAIGGTLYAASFLVGGALSLALIIPTLIIAAPPALLGAAIGALIGAAIPSTEAGDGALIGAIAGGAIPLAVGATIESVMMLPKALMYNTTGRLGAGLCAFAATGKLESKQLEGERFKIDKGSREKSTNEKLLDALFLVSLPEMAKSDKDLFGSTKTVEILEDPELERPFWMQGLD